MVLKKAKMDLSCACGGLKITIPMPSYSVRDCLKVRLRLGHLALILLLVRTPRGQNGWVHLWLLGHYKILVPYATPRECN
jgi:hypothetical protein